MGYLDSTSVTVDAVLTKQGRKVIANGGKIEITHFSLTDTGIDYNLWNTGHPSGSAYYGEALENLPQVEALPNAAYFMRNKLVTMPKTTTAMPIIDGVSDITFGKKLGGQTVIPTLLNATEPVGFEIIVPNTSYITVTGGTSMDISGNALRFIDQQDIPNAAMYSGTQFTITPQIVEEQKTFFITYISATYGAWVSQQITIDANSTKPTVTTNPTA